MFLLRSSTLAASVLQAYTHLIWVLLMDQHWIWIFLRAPFFADKVFKHYGRSIHSTDDTAHFIMVVSFSRHVFRLNDDSVAAALESAIGGSAIEFSVQLIRDKVFSFFVSCKQTTAQPLDEIALDKANCLSFEFRTRIFQHKTFQFDSSTIKEKKLKLNYKEEGPASLSARSISSVTSSGGTTHFCTAIS